MESQSWNAEDFRRWRVEMDWSQSQAAHVLQASRRSIIAWEQGAPIDGQIEHICRDITLVREVSRKEYSGLEVLMRFHQPLLRRIAEAEALKGRERWSLEEARDQIKQQRLATRSNNTDTSNESLARLEGIFAGDDALLKRLRRKAAAFDDEPLDADEPFVLYTRVYELVAPNRKKHSQCRAHVEVCSNSPPGPEMQGVDFYRGRVLELGRSTNSSMAFPRREMAEDWIEELFQAVPYHVKYIGELNADGTVTP